jgi:hypothetical protein
MSESRTAFQLGHHNRTVTGLSPIAVCLCSCCGRMRPKAERQDAAQVDDSENGQKEGSARGRCVSPVMPIVDHSDSPSDLTAESTGHHTSGCKSIQSK